MKIGIIGSGIVGQTLALGFEKHGYKVMIGTRIVRKLENWKNESSFHGLIGNFSETAAFGDILILAVKGSAAEEALKLSGKENHADKIVIDTTNPIADAPPANGVLQFFTGQNESLMERLQASFPHLRLVKAFSCIGSAHMVNPDFSEGKPSMFICGNDEAAKKEVRKILDLFGFLTEDMGKAEAARAIEPLCILWCIPGFIENRWNHALRMLKN
jgi:hypothetical protein